MRDAIDDLLDRMTLAEKVALLAGSDAWHTTPIPRLGVPALKVTDGPNGARGAGNFVGGLRSACFPAGIALAATWNPALVERVGQALGQEARTKGADVLLGPTVCLLRSPLGGRNFECFSEDPYLAGRMAAAYIAGVQGEGVGATIKHFACNDSEFERMRLNCEVGVRALRELHLAPFRHAVRTAGPWALMSAYNKVNGASAGEHPTLLTTILKEEWGYDGVVMSDWLGTHSTAAALAAGLDLEMPGPPVWRGDALRAAVEAGTVDVAAIDEAARRVLRLVDRATASGVHGGEEQEIDRPEHRAVAREAAAEAIVLLKNEHDVLPLNPATLTSLAIIGPNAKAARICGGGSARVTPYYAVTPFDGIVAQAPDSLKIGYELGCTNHKYLPLIEPELLTPGGGAEGQGLVAAYYDNPDLAGTPIQTTRVSSTEQVWFGAPTDDVDPLRFSVRLSGRFTPRDTGLHTFGLASAGLSRLLVDGRTAIDNWTRQEPGETFFGNGSAEATARCALEAGHAYDIAVEYRTGAVDADAELPVAGVRLGCLAPLPADAIARAASLAAASDVAVVCAGLSYEYEGEGLDRAHMDLVGDQAALIEAVAAANPRTVVVLNAGSPVTMPWLDRVAAVLYAWYPGQECGNALADVLFGAVSPSGKLPQTFPRRVQDNPAYLNYPGENGHVLYGEGIFLGYRYYDATGVAPLFPFGFGISYTTFRYDNLRLSASEVGPDETWQVAIDVTNTGERDGKEVVQVYIRDVASRLRRPDKELKGFAKVELAPGASTTVTFTLDREALAYYDDAVDRWVAEAGTFEVLVGASSQDIRAAATITLTATLAFGDRPAPAGNTAGVAPTALGDRAT